jgi:hypothetical protein
MRRAPSAAIGVGHSFATTVRDVGWLRGPPAIRSLLAMCASGDFWSSRATGVGHSRTARSVSVVPPPVSAPPDARESAAVAVGQEPEALAAVRSANGSRR